MSDASVSTRLERAREELLDLTLRNRLLNTPRHRARARLLEIVDERGDEVFRLLVSEGRSLHFLPARDSGPAAQGQDEAADDLAEQPIRLPQPEIDEGRQTVASRHVDAALQTELASDILQSRLLSLYYDARTIEQEQGVDILYLAIGFLKWFEDEQTEAARYAPLVLIPVQLERTSARSRFRLGLADDALCTNLSLGARLKTQFGLELPAINDEADDWKPGVYAAQVSQAIAAMPRWEVCPDDMVLGLFSFAKFLLYRDLAAEAWPAGKEVTVHPLVNALLGAASFSAQPPLSPDQEDLDAVIDPAKATHIVDADSSQTIAIEDVRNGRNLVIQGPPGTGKSQTITNLLAAAVQDGKSVLFVAEKMAALEVVKRRLDQAGLGNPCLELHSQKSKKTAVLEQLRTALDAPVPAAATGQAEADSLRRSRTQLNEYVDRLHEPIPPAGSSAYHLMGELIALRGQGIASPDFVFPESEKWTPADRQIRQQAVERAATLVHEMGQPDQHPWRGLGLETILPSDMERIRPSLRALQSQVDEVEQQARAVCKSLGLKPAETLAAVERCVLTVNTLAAAPVRDMAELTNACWKEHREQVRQLVDLGMSLQAVRAQLATTFADSAWKMDVTAIRRELLARGRNWFRWMFAAYRQAQLAYRNLCKQVPAGRPTEWVANLDGLIQAQQAAKRIDAQGTLGREAFGGQWRGAESDWKLLETITDWVTRLHQLGAESCLSRPLPDASAMASQKVAGEQLSRAAKSCRRAIEQAFAALRLDVEQGFAMRSDEPGQAIAWRCPGCGSRIKAVSDWKGQQSPCPACGTVHECGVMRLAAVPLAELRARFDDWQSSAERVNQWIAYRTADHQMRGLGLAPLADRLNEGRVAAKTAVNQFRMACGEALLRKRLADWPELARFQGRLHEQTVAEFCQQDRQLLERTRQRVARHHAEGIPRGDVPRATTGRGASKSGPLALLRHEINKKRRHLPVRQLLDQAGEVIQQIKPVFMMSPMSIAQYLVPGRLEFDLLVMDEASQVRPADALGAIARARQMVIVGDDQQLPPTRFFDTVLEESLTEDDVDDAGTRDLDSILGLCNARGVPSRMLRWHYRSRHHSLIAVSNREFYGGELIVVPSPVPRSAELGVSLRHVPAGVFDRGGTATNRIEAREVARAVMAHAERSPERSLGVGCFSVAQRDVILEELESLRRESTGAEAFFASDSAEPFFVKNLENVQGDERDEIFISVGYGRDAAGRLTMNFGPLSADGGQRRLNVLITRARRRCTVFSSIVADDIDLNRTSGRGPQVLKSYLEYCQHAAGEIPHGQKTVQDAFRCYLADRLSKAGVNVVEQVGLTGLYVDLGVSDPDSDGRFCLGIAGDGENYRSAHWARDRDRLRNQVLSDQGWNLLRVWTPDWFYRPDDELRHLLQQITAAREAAGREVAERITRP